MTRTLILAVAALAFATPARASLLLEFSGYTPGGRLDFFDYSLAAGSTFVAGETLTINGVDPTANVGTLDPFDPPQFAVNETPAGVLTLTALRDGSVTLFAQPVFELQSHVFLSTDFIVGDTTAFDSDGTTLTVSVPLGVGSPPAVPKPASLAMLGIGLALAGIAGRRIARR